MIRQSQLKSLNDFVSTYAASHTKITHKRLRNIKKMTHTLTIQKIISYIFSMPSIYSVTYATFSVYVSRVRHSEFFPFLLRRYLYEKKYESYYANYSENLIGENCAGMAVFCSVLRPHNALTVCTMQVHC